MTERSLIEKGGGVRRKSFGPKGPCVGDDVEVGGRKGVVFSRTQLSREEAKPVVQIRLPEIGALPAETAVAEVNENGTLGTLIFLQSGRAKGFLDYW